MLFPEGKDYEVANALDEYLKTGDDEHVKEISGKVGRLNLKAKLVSESGNYHREQVPEFFYRLINEINMMQADINTLKRDKELIEDFLRELDNLAVDNSVSPDFGNRLRDLTMNFRYRHGLSF